MKVILLDNIRGIGHIGDIKEVNDGYARNFLFAQGKAKPATAGIIKDVASLKAKKLQTVTLAHEQAQELAAQLSGSRIELTGKANAKGTLFAAIPEVTINGRVFPLPKPIKTIGEHPIVLELTDGISASVTVVVTPGRWRL